MDKKLKKIFNEKAKQARKDYIRDNLLKETLMDMFKDELAHYSEKEVSLGYYRRGILIKWKITNTKNYVLIWSKKQAQKVIELFKERFPNAADIEIYACSTNTGSDFNVNIYYIATEDIKDEESRDYKYLQILKNLKPLFLQEQSPMAKKKFMEILNSFEIRLAHNLKENKRFKNEEDFKSKYKAEDIRNVFQSIMEGTKDFSEPHFKFHSEYGLLSLTVKIKLPPHLHIPPKKWNACHNALGWAIKTNKLGYATREYNIKDVRTIDKETIEVIIDNTQG